MPAPQVYSLVDHWEELRPAERERYRVRALSSLHPDWVFCGVSAAAIYGLAVTNSLFGEVHLAVMRCSNARDRVGIVRHVISNDSIKVVDGIPVTSLARTTFDCISSCGFRAGLALADSSLRVCNKTREEFIDEFATFGVGQKKSWRATETMRYADGRSENGGESVVRAIMIEQGFMIPNLQVEIVDPMNPFSRFRVDYCWDLPGGRVVGELDGKEKYRNPAMTGGRNAVEVMSDERLRESRLTGTGAKVMRFSYKDAMNTEWFCNLLTSFGVPRGFAVPRVAQA